MSSSLDSIPLPGESEVKGGGEKQEKKKPKLRRLQDANQPASIIVTRVVATKPTNASDPETKLKAIAEKKKILPSVVPSNSSPSPGPSIQPSSAKSNSYSSNTSSNLTSVTMVTKDHSKSQPPSQTIVDELFKDFLAAKQKVESTPTDPNIVNSMAEMSKLLDEEISMINAKQISPSKSRDSKKKKKGRWDKTSRKSHDSGSKCEKNEQNRDRNLLDLGVKVSGSGNGVNQTYNSVHDGESGEKTDEGMMTNDESMREQRLDDGGKKAMKVGIKLEISSDSLNWISSGETMDQKKQKVLEEGEVLSSSTDENSGLSESDKDNCPSETGSISSDREGKSKKKKKKHKHKHKKKKKHKSQKGEKKSKDKSFKERDSKKDKADGGKKKDKEEKKDKKKDDDSKSKSSEKRKHSRSRSRSPKRRRSRSKSRELFPERFDEWDARRYLSSGSRDRSRSRSNERNYDRSHHRESWYHDDRYRDRSRERDRGKDRSRDRGREHSRDRERLRAKEEKDLRVKIDKSKLRKIAIANVLAAVKAGEQGADVDLATLKAGGKSVEELTDFCKKISEKDCSASDSDSDYGRASDIEDGDTPFINHPFKLRDPSSLPNIIMNIRNSKQLPVLTPQAKATQSATLRLQFPVSSGSQHRQKENEWVPVEKTTAPATQTTVTTVAVLAPTAQPTTVATTSATSSTTTAAEAATQIATATTTTAPVAPEDKVFPDPPSKPIDIGAIVSERLSLVRKLTENPYDVQALCSLHKSQEKSSQWAVSKFLPGQFTGSTGVQTLSQQELAGPDKKNQAWFKKDQLKKAAPVQGGIGMWLLQKMGWRQGEGLGKNNEGSKEPLMLDFKIDRKGLTSDGENTKKGGQVAQVKDLSGKHPVSALTELCNKRRWRPPSFITVSESGPDHKKNFLFKVVVNGVEYQPSTASANKKQAKAQAASVCLQTLGLIPRE